MAKTKKKSRIVLRLILWLLGLIILIYNPLSVRLMVYGTALYYEFDTGIFYRMIKTESSFRSFAVSRQKAVGLGQVQETTAFYMNDKHKRGALFFPLYNLKISSHYIKYLQTKYMGNWSLVLAAYNWGETKVSNRIKGITIDPEKNYRELFRDVPETYNYIGKILTPEKRS